MADFTHNVVLSQSLRCWLVGSGGWDFNWLWRLCIWQCWPNAFWKTLVYEAMMRYLMMSFFKWCEHKAILSVKNFGINSLMWWFLWRNNMDLYLWGSSRANLCNSIVYTLIPLLNIFNEAGLTKSPTFKCWNAYINAVEILIYILKE